MDSFEKKIQNSFTDNEGSKVPEGYGWEDMHEGIYEKMEEEKPSRKPLWIWLMTFGAVLISAGVLFTIYPFQNENSHETTFSKTETIIETNDEGRIGNNIRPNQNPSKPEIENSISLAQKSESIDRIIHKDSNAKDGLQAKSRLVISNGIAERSTIEIQSGNIRSNAQQSFDNSMLVEENKLEYQNENTRENTSLPKLSTKEIVKVSKLDSRVILLEIKSDLRVGATVENKLLEEHSKARVPISITVASGSTLWGGLHNNAAYRDDYTKNLLGYYVSVGGNYETKSKWQYSLGYNQQNLISLFEFDKRDIFERELIDTVIAITTNSLNGSENLTRGDTTISSPRHRDVTYYNTHKTHSLFIGVGKQVDINSKLKLLVDTRITTVLKMDADGYALDSNEELIHYNTDKELYSSFQVAIGMGISLDYEVNSQWSIFGGFHADQYLTDWDKDAKSIYKPYVFNLGGGLKYRF